MKNKKLLLLMLIGILVVSSIMVEAAIGDNLKGMRAVRGVSIPVLVVNIIVVTLSLYVVFGLLGSKLGFFKADTKSGKIVMLIVVIGFAIAIAFRAGNLWIWEEEVAVRPALRFLFDANGILRPSRILIFIGASALLSWLFTSKVKIGQGKNGVDIVIAVILAAAMTREGLTKNMLIAGGQIISIILLYLQFKREGEEGFSPSAAVWSVGLVIWISAIAFPGQGLGVIKSITPKIGVFGYFRYIVYLIVFAFIAMVTGHFYKKKKKDGEAKHNFVKNIGQHIWQRIVDFMNRTRLPVLNTAFRTLNVHNVVLGDPDLIELGVTFRKIWFELFTNMNYLLRLEVYDAKGSYVREAKVKVGEILKGMKEKKGATYLHLYTESIVNSNVDRYKIGTGFKGPNLDGSWSKEGRAGYGVREDFYFINNNGELEKDYSYKAEPGALSIHYAVLAFFEEFVKGIEYFKTHTPPVREVVAKAESLFESTVEDSFKTQLSAVEKGWGTYMKYIDRRGGYSLIKNEQLMLLLQLRKTGERKHSYRFARIGAKIYKINYEEDVSGNAPRDSDEPPFFKFRATVSFADPLERDHDALHDHMIRVDNVGKPLIENEVDSDGYFIADLNELRLKGKCHRGYVRRVKPKASKIVKDIEGKNREVIVDNIIVYPDFEKAASWLEEEWRLFFRDVRDGRFHPNSRIAEDYRQRHAQERKFNYKNLPRTGRPDPTAEGRPAFDREALKDIGRFMYWGKETPTSTEGEMLNCDNPFPTLSTKGMAHYLRDFIDTFAQEVEKKQAESFVYDTGIDESLFSGSPKNTKK